LNPPSAQVVCNFAETFCSRNGMTREEILQHFKRYSNNILDPQEMGLNISTKANLFRFCLTYLQIEDQYRFLLELCFAPPSSSRPIPSEEQRTSLATVLFSNGAENGLNLRGSTIPSWKIKTDWLKTISRIEKSPASAITSARTTLEDTCKEILIALNQQDLAQQAKGDLARLIKSTRKTLGIKPSPEQITAGIASILNGVSSGSNELGDRHGTGQISIIPLVDTRFICDICFSLSLFFHDVFITNYKN